MGVGAGFCMCDIVVKSSRSLSHVLMSSCYRTWSLYAICCRPSVCRLSVTFVRPTQPVEIFGNISTPFGTSVWYTGHPLTAMKNFTGIVPGEPLRREVKHKRGRQISYSGFGPIEGYLGNSAR